MDECEFCGGEYDSAAMYFHRRICERAFQKVLPARLADLEQHVREIKESLAEIKAALNR